MSLNVPRSVRTMTRNFTGTIHGHSQICLAVIPHRRLARNHSNVGLTIIDRRHRLIRSLIARSTEFMDHRLRRHHGLIRSQIPRSTKIMDHGHRPITTVNNHVVIRRLIARSIATIVHHQVLIHSLILGSIVIVDHHSLIHGRSTRIEGIERVVLLGRIDGQMMRLEVTEAVLPELTCRAPLQLKLVVDAAGLELRVGMAFVVPVMSVPVMSDARQMHSPMSVQIKQVLPESRALQGACGPKLQVKGQKARVGHETLVSTHPPLSKHKKRSG